MKKMDNATDKNKFLQIGDVNVRRIGLGTNRITDTEQNRALLKHALEIGINFIDTANIYTGGASEAIIGSTLSPFPDNIVVTTKGGMVRGEPANNKPEYLKAAIEGSLRRLKTKCITLYQVHRINPDTPVEKTMEFLKQMQEAGKIKHIGLSEVSIEQIQKAQSVGKVTTVQNHYNLSIRKHEEVIDYCEQNDIIFIPFFPLESGKSPDKTISDIAEKHDVTPFQIVIAWLLKRSPAMLPIPGTLSIKHLEENLEAEKIELSNDEFDLIGKPS